MTNTRIDKFRDTISSFAKRIPLPEAWHGRLIFIAVHVLFLLVTCHKLTNASLWFDEAVEWLVSTMSGKEMYDNIIFHFQPPLYNWLMHVWLNINFGEIWFRLSSVLFGFIGCFGLYFTINKLIGWKSACLSVFFYTFLRNVIYYNQECSEYALVLACLFWTIYFGVCLLNEFSIKLAVGYAFCCVLSMYSQYGAAFTVIGLSLVILYRYFSEKLFSELRKLSVILASAAAIFGLPLYYFFLRVQRAEKSSQLKKAVYKNPFDELKIFINNLIANCNMWFNLFFKSKFGLSLIEIILIALAIISIYCMLQRKNKTAKHIACAATVAYLMYHIAVRTAQYGGVGDRHTLPLPPIVIVAICTALSTVLLQIKHGNHKIQLKYIGVRSINLRSISFFALAGLLLVNNIYSWNIIRNNWTKENTRDATRLYFDQTNGEEDLYVYYAAVPGFAFYANLFGYDYGIDALSTSSWGFLGTEMDPQAAQYGNFHYGELIRGKDVEYIKASVSKSFSDNLPNTFWFMLSHIFPDQQQFHDAFYDLGYSYQVYRWNDARLLKLYNDEGIKEKHVQIFDYVDNTSSFIIAGNNVALTADQNRTIIEATGTDPQTIFSFPDISYDINKEHMLMLEFFSEFSGNVKAFYISENENYDKNHVINAQYLPHNTRLLIHIPPNVDLQKLRLDFENTGVKDGQGNIITVSGAKVFEMM